MIVGLLRTILFLVIFYYLFKFVGRLLMPYLAKKGMEKMQASKNQAYQQFKQKKKAEEGKVTINNVQKQKPTTGSSDGEYVDFEEVK